jgi:hypothetical protein
MVNGRLKLAIPGVDNASTPLEQQKERIFATKSALTSKDQRCPGAQKSFWNKRFLVY